MLSAFTPTVVGPNLIQPGILVVFVIGLVAVALVVIAFVYRSTKKQEGFPVLPADGAGPEQRAPPPPARD